MTRRVTIHTPLGEQLHFRELRGQENISQLFSLDVEMLSESESIDPKALLGKNATIEIETQGGGRRFIDGIVTRFGMQGQDHRHYAYKARLSPWLWLATRKSDFRIFQNLNVPDIVEQVLGVYGHPMQRKLTRAYRSWDYCVQYNESDCDFVSRLMEHEGIYYFFEHASGRHTLVLCDDIIASHGALPGGESIPFYPPEKAAAGDQENIHAWQLEQEIKPGRHYIDDYDFKKPRAELSHMRRDPPGHAHDGHETYEWPGGYTEYGDGDAYIRVRLKQGLTGHSRVRGQSCHRALATGYTFSLYNYPRGDQNRQYLITGLSYHLKENPRVSAISSVRGVPSAPSTRDGAKEEGSFQRYELQAQPTSLAFTPPRTTPKPRTTGPQTAVVVGPAGEEIWTDEYGRIKVQFHWDRLGSKDQNSSCWIRVATNWAGPGFGAISIPRIGHEVVVDFLNGDPDYPIVTGCVYNAANMPPWALPANATQSGIKTRSSKGGAAGAGMKNGPGDANAIRFEDKAGQEQLWLHAQKDQLTEVENDEDKWVGNDRRKTVDRDETNVIHRDRTETVDRDETITVHNNRTERVDHNEKVSIGDNRNEDVGIDENISIGKNRSKTIGKTETDKIGQNWHVTVGLLKTQTIGMAYMQNVGVMKMMNIGVNYMENIGVAMQTTVGMSQNLTVGQERQVKVGSKQSTEVGSQYSLTVGGGGAGGGAGGGMAMNITAPGGGGGGGGGGGKASQLTMDGQSIELNAAKIRLEAQQEILLTCGKSTIRITPGDIQILSPTDRLNC